MYVYCF